MKAESGMARIRRIYGVPAKRGMIVTYMSSRDQEVMNAKIVSSTSSDRLLVKLENCGGSWNKKTTILHPTWNVDYPKQKGGGDV